MLEEGVGSDEMDADEESLTVGNAPQQSNAADDRSGTIQTEADAVAEDPQANFLSMLKRQ